VSGALVLHAQTISPTGRMVPLCGWSENPVTARDRASVTCVACQTFLTNRDIFASAHRPPLDIVANSPAR
jgi:hypothetical protein